MSTPTSPPSAPTRGELRIYLGAAPGVGKTFAMLGEARRRQSRGCDVVIAVVETHGRRHTADLLDGLEVIPRRDFSHRGVELAEMDLNAVLARRPEVALVDELAHTNAPGARHAKRWQDVEDLLAAGIDVLSTVNVQHLESLNDVVQDITGVVQQETVPDEVVRRAEQVELVDITPEALRRRLSHGNVYRPEQVDAALGNYFRPGNLTALREIALLWVANQVDTALAKYRTDHAITSTWEARERTVVSVTGGPESETLIRRAKRIATRVGGELVVVHVVRGDGVAGVSPTGLQRMRRLAEGMGATVHNVVGDDVPAALLEFARGINATQMVLGTSRRSRWARIFDDGVAANVIRDSGPIDVHLVTHEEAGTRKIRPVATGTSRPRTLLSWVAAVLAPVVATLLLIALGQVADLNSQGVLYFVVVLGVALLGGVGPAVLAAVLSGGLLNFFFTEPRYSLTIAEPDNLITLVVLMLVAVAVALLVDAAARRARDARTATREAELLALFASHVLRGADLAGLLDRLRETYGQRSVALLRRDGDGTLHPAARVGVDPPTSAETADTSCEVADGDFVLVLRGPALTARDRRVLRAVTYQAVGLLRQTELAAQAAGAEALAQGDELRRALLSAVSHDLRTPLASIKAGVSALRSTDVQFSATDTAELLAGVEDGADHLTTLVDNLLDSSRLAAGVVHPRMTAVSCEEVVYRALAGLHAGDRVVIDAGASGELLPAVLADPGLLERVLANLLSNALRHAPTGPVRVSAVERNGRVGIRISDSGPGLPRDAITHLFEPFQRLGDSSTGVGLGLTVVKGFTEAMGGTVTAEDSPGGGLTMVVELASAMPVSVQVAR